MRKLGIGLLKDWSAGSITPPYNLPKTSIDAGEGRFETVNSVSSGNNMEAGSGVNDQYSRTKQAWILNQLETISCCFSVAMETYLD